MVYFLFLSDPLKVNKGVYTLKIKATVFEKGTDVRIEFVNHGLVFGLFGTDHMRRDITTAILWGAPIALAFGLLAAAGTSILSMLIAAIGAWFGGWIDELIQRITEINLVLPFLSILIMVGTFYSRSIWVILGVTIALSIFTGAIKTDGLSSSRLKSPLISKRRKPMARAIPHYRPLPDSAHHPAAHPGFGFSRAELCFP